MRGLLKKLNRANNRERHRDTNWGNIINQTGKHRTERHSYTRLMREQMRGSWRAETRGKTNGQHVWGENEEAEVRE